MVTELPERYGGPPMDFDDDGREKRTGTWVTATAHIITAVIGSGVLSLAWAVAQLGWIGGIVTLAAFACITCFTSTLLADCYRSPDRVTGKRNYTYVGVVKANLGGMKVKLCGVAQNIFLVGLTIGYAITTSISIGAIKKSNCFHKNGHNADCRASNNLSMVAFGALQIILSQLQNFQPGHNARTSLTGTTIGVDVTRIEKVWNTFQAIGNIAFAIGFSSILVEIQDTLKSSPPENQEMKKAALVGCLITTLFYGLCGFVGYAAFGNTAPGNFLTGFGFFEPFWLIDFANACIIVHLVGAYQVICQPIFAFVEKWCSSSWPHNGFITTEYPVQVPLYGVYYLNMFRLVWRPIYVIVSIVIAMILPFFNDFVGLLGALTFYPLTVYFPVEMYMSQTKIPKYSRKWFGLKALCWVCLIVSLVAAAGSIQGLIKSLKMYKPFQALQ